jgi:NADH:ubiquinone oxidoreductase subunit F (NADH-binding)
LRESPHQVLEGLIIGAFLVGAEKGFIFIRSADEKSCSLSEQAIRDAGYTDCWEKYSGTSFDFESS